MGLPKVSRRVVILALSHMIAGIVGVAAGAGAVLHSKASGIDGMIALGYYGQHAQIQYSQAQHEAATDALERYLALIEQLGARLDPRDAALARMDAHVRLAALADRAGNSKLAEAHAAGARVACAAVRWKDCSAQNIRRVVLGAP
jgi:hypothetical protein